MTKEEILLGNREMKWHKLSDKDYINPEYEQEVIIAYKGKNGIEVTSGYYTENFYSWEIFDLFDDGENKVVAWAGLPKYEATAHNQDIDNFAETIINWANKTFPVAERNALEIFIRCFLKEYKNG